MKKVIILMLCCIISFMFGHITTVMRSDFQNTEICVDSEKNVENADINENQLPFAGRSICVDAGHGISSYNKQEPIAPGSSQTKIAFASGTSGKNLTEEELNLSVALKLETRLISMGATVYMTRTTHECDMTNIDRAQLANKKNVDISVKIHADGSDNTSAKGISLLIPSTKYIHDENICYKSKQAGELILENVIKHTGAQNRGIIERGDLTGFNWTQVPIVLLEMGFMTNQEEDAKLETSEYQDKIVEGIIDGLIAYFEISN